MISHLKSVVAFSFLAFGLILGVSSPLQAAPKSEPWPLWETHNPDDTRILVHQDWQYLLDRYLKPSETGPSLFDYGAVRPEDKARLDRYIAMLEATEISGYNRDVQYAYWFNFYNALTIQVMLDHWPTETILDVDLGGGFFANGPWTKKLVRVEGTELSLNDMEHRILRPGWNDPRIHYGVNCASIGCPNLMEKAFHADTVDQLLTEGAILFINSARGVRFEDDGDLVVSKIYDWFQEDFEGTEQGVIDHLRDYAYPDLLKMLEGRTKIEDYEYDWGVNAAQKSPTS